MSFPLMSLAEWCLPLFHFSSTFLRSMICSVLTCISYPSRNAIMALLYHSVWEDLTRSGRAERKSKLQEQECFPVSWLHVTRGLRWAPLFPCPRLGRRNVCPQEDIAPGRKSEVAPNRSPQQMTGNGSKELCHGFYLIVFAHNQRDLN